VDRLRAILVDDGSPDDSAAIAKDSAPATPVPDRRAAEPGTRPGPQHRRTHADGEYITFVDSDDLVTRTASRSWSGPWTRPARRSPAATPAVQQHAGVRPSWIHRCRSPIDRIATHVIETPDLILDRMVWNKSTAVLLDEYGYEFPAIRYEDYPVTLKRTWTRHRRRPRRTGLLLARA